MGIASRVSTLTAGGCTSEGGAGPPAQAAGAGPPGWSAGFLGRTSALLLRRQASARADGYELRLDSSCAGQPGPAFGQPRQAASGRLCPAESSASPASWSRTGVGLRVSGEARSRPVTPCGPGPPGSRGPRAHRRSSLPLVPSPSSALACGSVGRVRAA